MPAIVITDRMTAADLTRIIEEKLAETTKPSTPTVKRQVWMVVYAWSSSPNTTLREMYWSEESAMERAAHLMPHCREVFVGNVAELQPDISNLSSAPFADGLAFANAVERDIEAAVKAAGRSLDYASRVRIGTEAVCAWNQHHAVQGAA